MIKFQRLTKKLVERFSGLADAKSKFLYLLAYVYIFEFCSVFYRYPTQVWWVFLDFVNSLLETVDLFQHSDHSRLSFGLVFDNLVEKFDYLFSPVRYRLLQFLRSLKFKPNSFPCTHNYSNTQLFETQKKNFSLRVLQKF